jgi:sulfur-oxidizing protein SoxY
VTASRRRVLAQGLGAALCLGTRALPATPELRDAAIAELTGGAPVQDGRVRLTIPAVAENGLSVYATITVESPMTTDDHVRAIHLIAEANPIARLVSFRLGPRAGAAQVATNIRLAASQRVTALAELSDGTYWSDVKPVIVTLAACIDGG